MKTPQVTEPLEGYSYALHPIATATRVTPKLPTYKAVKALLWKRLEADGWKMSSPTLKVPHAIDSAAYRGRVDQQPSEPDKRVWFKPQSIHVGFTSKLGDAHTITYDDIRTVSTSRLVTWIESR